MSGKRPAEDELLSKQRYTRIRLASPSPTNSNGSDTESIHSCQGYETEFVKDTSDTSSPAYDIEYEISETEERKGKFFLTDNTDDSEMAIVADLNSEIGSLTSLDLALLGDTSEENPTSPTSNSDVDPGLPRKDYLDFEKCLLCQTDKKDISYPYCSTCFTWKKNLFPSRPKKRQKIIKKEQTQSINSNSNSNTNKSTEKLVENSAENKTEIRTDNAEAENLGHETHLSQGYFEDSGMGSSGPHLPEDVADTSTGEPSTSAASTSNTRKLTLDMCRVCYVKPENGLFVHLNIAHVYGCYTCAKKIWYHNGGCPICRRKIFKVAKLFV